MAGKVRGFLILFIAFTTLAVVFAALAFFDADRIGASVRPWLTANVPWVSGGGSEDASGTPDGADQVPSVAEVAVQALKSGKAKPGELYEMGQLAVKANREGQLDEAEFDRLVDLADKTGVMDQMIDQALASNPPPPARPPNPQPSASPNRRNSVAIANLRSQLQRLIAAFNQARSDGRISTGEVMAIARQAQLSGLQEQVMRMLPPGYDQTRIREAVRNLIKGIVTGKASMREANSLIDMFDRAQADGRLDRAELDRIAQKAESMAR